MTRAAGRAPRRSAREWVVRATLALAAAAGGYVGTTRSLAAVQRTGAPAAAHRLAPGDGRMTAAFAQLLVRGATSPSYRPDIAGLARTALRQDATTVEAVSTLGIEAQLRGDVTSARRLFGYAERLSRRNLETQLWGIEEAVARSDVPGALRHYDIALRTNPIAYDLLFPVLASAASGDAVRGALVDVLARGPIWTAAFINYAAASGKDARATAHLFLALDRARVPISPGATAAVVDGLFKAGSPQDAWTYYARSHAGVDPRRSRDPRFTADIATPSPFDWTPIAEGGGVATITHGAMDFSMPASVGGPVLQQMQVLPSGDYRLDGRQANVAHSAGASPYWVLACWNGAELGRVELAGTESGGFAGNLRVPAGCPVQTLTLVMRASDAIDGSLGTIERVALRPAR